MGHLGKEIVWLQIILQMAILMAYFALTIRPEVPSPDCLTPLDCKVFQKVSTDTLGPQDPYSDPPSIRALHTFPSFWGQIILRPHLGLAKVWPCQI